MDGHWEPVDASEVARHYIRCQEGKEHSNDSAELAASDAQLDAALERLSAKELMRRAVEHDRLSMDKWHVSAALRDGNVEWQRGEVDAAELRMGLRDPGHSREVVTACRFSLVGFARYVAEHPEDQDPTIAEFRFPLSFRHAEIIVIWERDKHTGRSLYRIKDGYHRAVCYVVHGRCRIPAFLGRRRDGQPWEGNPNVS